MTTKLAESDHTPGPWASTPTEPAGQFAIYSLSAIDGRKHRNIGRVEREEDARLIASAPDMAAEIVRLNARVTVLRAALAETMQLVNLHYNFQHDRAALAAYDRARAALAGEGGTR